MPGLNPAVNDDDHIQGDDPDAPITLVEYGDYQCSFCGRAYPQIKEAQAALGQDLRFVFRNFPITTLHPNAENAAEAAETAAKSGKVWEMHDMLFENQSALDVPNLVKYAVELGLDRDTFVRDLEEHTTAERVRRDFLSGVRSGVNGTPTFFINGERYDGNWDHGHLLMALKQLLR
jgi:protein-disulfide isomerase